MEKLISDLFCANG